MESTRRRRASRRIFGLMAAAALLAGLGAAGLLVPVQNGVSYLSRPLASGLSGVGDTLAGWWEVVGSAGTLAKDNQRLRSEVASLRQQLAQSTELRAQNQQLRAQLGMGEVRPDTLVAAEVIGYQPDNFRQFITIGRGSEDGLRSGMAVVSQGALVGTLQDVAPTTSKVFLIIDPNFRVTGLDQTATNRPTGTIHGQIGSGLMMDKIAQNETIQAGDTIVTTGTGTEIPKGMIIGHVQTVDKKDNGVFQTAQVTSDVQFNRLEIVYVVARP
jgi:rod shape-determining protein MreC